MIPWAVSNSSRLFPRFAMSRGRLSGRPTAIVMATALGTSESTHATVDHAGRNHLMTHLHDRLMDFG
jgi:hypothetical protein